MDFQVLSIIIITTINNGKHQFFRLCITAETSSNIPTLSGFIHITKVIGGNAKEEVWAQVYSAGPSSTSLSWVVSRMCSHY